MIDKPAQNFVRLQRSSQKGELRRRYIALHPLLLSVLTIFSCLATARADEPVPQQTAAFENTIRPLLLEHCIECHGPKKAESGLRLDTRQSLMSGGDRGPTISLEEPQQSLLIGALRHADGLDMPPDNKLSEHDIAAVEQWIEDGAAWPSGVALGGAGAKLRRGSITDDERAFWSFQPISDPRPPAIDEAGIVNDIDRFVHQKLRDAQLAHAGPASRREWIRRATFDLTGLPPTSEEVRAYLADDSVDADAAVIDRLLQSVAYGERWGRHWLDVVRYADTAGETADYPIPLAYKYRNWVIDAFNADMPYDQFVQQQLAGDLLSENAVDSENYRDMRTATGFIAISRRFGFDVENYHNLTIQDTIDVVGQSMLGLTLGCARCHDHKFDPVNMDDYYAWYGIFDSTRYSFPGSEEKKRPYDLVSSIPPTVLAERQMEYSARAAALVAEIEKLTATLESTPEQGAVQAQVGALTAQHEALQQQSLLSLEEQIYGATEQETPHDSHVQLRGELTRPGAQVSRRNLEILGSDPLPVDAGSGRLQLATWITREDNPLFARVMVNRIWQKHFGRGLVATENDFGLRGDPPSHPELLDWLASRFQESGYSVKAMHRLIMASAAYHRASTFESAAAQADPDARLLWRFNRRRLSAEEIRDAMLQVSGNLDRSMGQAHPFPAVETWGFTQHTPFYDVYPTNRRSVYLMQQRLKRHPFLGLFDGADTNASTARRDLTTVPTQALFLMNNDLVHEQGTAFALRFSSGPRASLSIEERIRLAYDLALLRSPSSEEVQAAQRFLTIYRDATGSESTAWSAFARTLLTRNEFLFVD